MPVHFKGVSEYRSKYKGRTRSRSDSPHRRMRLAGLRSDQSRITREPQFTSKRKVPFFPSKPSTSFRREGHALSKQHQERRVPVSSPAVTPVLRHTSTGKEGTSLAPRDQVPPEGIAAPQPQPAQTQAAQTTTSIVDQHKQTLNGNLWPESVEEQVSPNEVNHVLRKRAGLKSENPRNGRLNSEYQRQFLWKTPVVESPLLAAHEMLYSNNRAIPPFKSNPVIMESEYKRSFKGSPPPRPPRLRRDVEQYEIPLPQPENKTPEKSKSKKKEQRIRKSSPEEEVTHLHQQEVRSPKAPRDPSPQVIRKLKTEYRSNFRSPLQYNYKDGAWVKIKSANEEECDGFHEWYHEVRELRERAEAYRKRAWGTHFSRQHMNQILSEHNWMWEPSSGTSSSSLEDLEACRSPSNGPIIEALDLAGTGSVRGSSSLGPSASVAASRRSSPEDPTLPVQRRLAWDEEERLGDRDKPEIAQEELTVEKNKGNLKDEHGKERNERLHVLETESSSSVVEGSADSINRGRLPTPKLKTLQTVQRTHHDRTTPATGGALLVSPPRIKHSSRGVRRNEPPLGKPHSPYKHIPDGSPQRAHSKAENGSLPRSSPAAGLTTVDLLPMREDAWSEEEVADYTNPRQPRSLQKQQTSLRHTANVALPVNRIQGTMRNPEFQHNGNLGIFRPEQFVFPASDYGVSDNDDKMSHISSRSAASCSVASELLDRAQRRKEEFWGKS